jgi:hypothetical protein
MEKEKKKKNRKERERIWNGAMGNTRIMVR